MCDICRFCLNNSAEIMYDLVENRELLTKISSCLNIDLLKYPSLPNQICETCKETIQTIHNFHKKIIQNELILLEQLNKKNIPILENIKEEPNGDFHNHFTDINETLKTEIETDDAANYSSDDDLSLLVLKDKKKRITFKRKTKKKDVQKRREVFDSIELKNKNIKNEIEAQDEDQTANEKQHKCLTCFEVFDCRRNLSKHYKVKHKPKNLYKWKDCIVFEEEKYKCKKCKKIFDDNKKKAINHGSYCCIEERPYLCNICGRTYRAIQDILQHSKAHNGVKYVCSFKCGYSTVYLSGLKFHEQRHKNEYKYKCDKCGKGFQVRTWFEEHQNTHSGARPYSCHICGLSYQFRKYLTKHISSAHPQSSDVKKFVCIHCGLPCDSKGTLKEHFSEVHGIKSFYLCDSCGKTFARPCHLQAHKATHIGAKPHICSICKKCYSTRYHLKRHISTHSGVKAHACTKCGKTYAQLWTLQQHNLRHHNTSFYNCDKCETSFSTSIQLYNHKKTCQKDQIKQ